MKTTQKAHAATAEAPARTRTLFEDTPLAPMPAELEREDQEATALVQLPTATGPRTIQQLTLEDPARAEVFLSKLHALFANLRALSIKMTKPQDWVLFRDKGGEVTAHLCDSGAVKVRQLWGISVYRHRGAPEGAMGQVTVREEPLDGDSKGKDRKTVKVAEVWADGVSALTGQWVPGVSLARRSTEDFVGRGHDQDLRSAVRTGIDAKVVRLLSGLRRVPLDELVTAGLDVEHCRKGSGYGTSAERAAAGVAEAGVPERVAKLREEILRRVGGGADAARQLCREITRGDKAGKDGKVFPGWESPDRLTQGWQIDNALKKLAAHPTFGDLASEPGGEG